MDRETVTGRQAFFLLFLFLMGNLITANGGKSLRDGWLLYLLLGALAIPVSLLFVRACRRRCAGEIFVASLGPRVGGPVTAAYMILAVLLASDAIRQFADFIVINDLNDAGAWGNSALMVLIIALLLAGNLRSLGNTAWGIFPMAALALLTSLAVTIPRMSLDRLLPVFSEEPKLLAGGAVSGAANLLAPAFFPIAALGGAAEKEWKRSVLLAELTACLMLALLSLRTAAVLGFPAMSLFRFPGFAAASAARHSELLVSAAFVFCQPFRAALCLRYAQECLTYWKPRWKKWYAPALVLLSVVNLFFSWTSQHERWRVGGEAVTVGLLLLGPLAAVIADMIRERREKKPPA